MQTLPTEISRLFQYLEKGVSPFHVAAYGRQILKEAGFKELKLNHLWRLEKGNGYFCCPFDTTLYAFTVGENCDLSNGIHIGGAHTDFPAIKIKPSPEIRSHGYLQLNTEVYGGPILNTYFDRPLSLAGKVVTRGDRYDRPVPHLIDFKRPVLCLPNLAVHMSRTVNETGSPIDNQKHLRPILGTEKPDTAANNAPKRDMPESCAPASAVSQHDFSGNNGLTESVEKGIRQALNGNITFTDLLAEELGISSDSILDYDLCIYNMDPPRLAGLREEFITAPRLDDITSVCTLLYGLIEGRGADRINLVCLFDNEEIGSLSKQGADSSLPAVIIEKIWKAFGKDHADCLSEISEGLMLSVDVAHAFHPNYPETQDITNYPVLNKGLILKTASNQSYTWDCEALASMIALCEENRLPYQRFAKHSNMKGGGTIGSIISSRLPMKTVDLGAGLLAMHSSQEMMGVEDQIGLSRLMRAFFSA